jgi:hypothetical protein
MRSRAPAQAFLEYGLIAAVVVLAFLGGASVLNGATVTYLSHTEPTPPPAVLGALPNHTIDMTFTCTPIGSPIFTGRQFNCAVTVTDITTPGPASMPEGSVHFTTSQGNIPDCPLTGSGVTSGCTAQYTPVIPGAQSVMATYVPTSSHLSMSKQLLNFVNAVDQTTMVLRCPLVPIPVGEPFQCTATVNDLFPGFGTAPSRLGPISSLPVTINAGTGTFTPPLRLGPQTPNSDGCPPIAYDGSGACTFLFRSNPVASEAGASHTLSAAYAGSQNYQPASASASITVGAVNQHPVSVTVSCTRGTLVSSPLQVNLNASTNCTATVRDTIPNDSNGNPRAILPTGTVNWSPSPQYGAGNFTASSCALARVSSSTASCQVTYKPTSIGDPPAPYIDTQTLTANYAGDVFHNTPTSGSQKVYAADQHPTSVTVACPPTPTMPLILGGVSPATTQCTAWVTDTVSGRPTITPTGNVNWTGPTGAPDYAGSITGSPCALVPVDAATAQCQVTYQPTAAGSNPVNAHQLTASYAGDSAHPGSPTGSGPVYVASIHAANVLISCVPVATTASPLSVGPPATSTVCTFNVQDPSSTPVAPTGSINWNMTSVGGGTGDFNPVAPGPCTLVQVDSATATCATPVTYTPSSVGTPDGTGPGLSTHQINVAYTGDSWHQVSSGTSGVPVGP